MDNRRRRRRAPATAIVLALLATFVAVPALVVPAPPAAAEQPTPPTVAMTSPAGGAAPVGRPRVRAAALAPAVVRVALLAPGAGTLAFGFEVTGPDGAGAPFALTDSATPHQLAYAVAAGSGSTVSISQDASARWAVRDITCGTTGGRKFPVAGTAVRALVVHPGDDLTCTFTDAPRYSVTLVARECPTYADVFPNAVTPSARRESEEPLGAGRSNIPPYFPGILVSPEKEGFADHHDACTPITGWRLTLGDSSGVAAPKVSPPGLSVLTGPYSDSVYPGDVPVTAAAAPQLDSAGLPTGGSVAGSVTVELTGAQAALGQVRSQLWVQGGTPAKPLNGRTDVEFATVRCGDSNENGDNVEYLHFSAGVQHLYCYAYYVRPTGTIVVENTTDDPSGAETTFPFSGTAGPDAGFTLQGGPLDQPAVDGVNAATFRQAATEPGADPYSLRGFGLPDGWSLASVTCTSANETAGSGEASTTRRDPVTGDEQITLAADDVVTCAYVHHFTAGAGSPYTGHIESMCVAGAPVMRYALTGLRIGARPTFKWRYDAGPDAGVVVTSVPDGASTDPIAGVLADQNLTFTAGTPAGSTISVVDDGSDPTVITGELLWPDTEVDSAGRVTDWPGWTTDADGTHTATQDFLRPRLTLVISVPDSAAVVTTARSATTAASRPTPALVRSGTGVTEYDLTYVGASLAAGAAACSDPAASPRPRPNPAPLPQTGASVAATAGAGIGAVLLGFLLLGVGSHQRRRETGGRHHD